MSLVICPRVRRSSTVAAALIGSLGFAAAAQAAVTSTEQTSTSVNASPFPSWYHTPLSAAELRDEVAVPRDPEQVTGPVRRTRADYRNRTGKLAVDARQAIGQTLIAGESLQLPGGNLFRLNSHLPVAAALQELTELKPALVNVTGATCEGYTDYGPNSRRRDMGLGKRRALRVCALIHAENPKIATKTVSYGSTLPAVVGGTTHGQRSVNRRVVVDITTSTTPPAPTPTPAPTSVPRAPTLNSVTPGDHQATAGFIAPTSNSTDQPTGYEVSTDAGATWAPVSTTEPSPYTITISGLMNGTTYTVEVRAVDSAGDGPASNSIQVTPVSRPDAPTIIDGSWAIDTGDDNYDVTLSWTAGNDGGSPITGWQYSQDGGPYTLLSNVTNASGTYSGEFDTGVFACDDVSETYTLEAINGLETSAASNAFVVHLDFPLYC